jgi:hypothetical protein
MTSLIFITPVWGRYELTAICLEQRRWLCDELKKEKIDAQAVIIGDDNNLEVAEALGFITVERDNEYLSRKFNDGYEAAWKHGFDYCYPVGSDSWLSPSQFHGQLGSDIPIASHYYTLIHETGTKRIDCKITVPGGIGPLIVPVRVLGKFDGRPIDVDLKRGCDNAARQRFVRADIELKTREDSQYEHTAFQSGVTQITDYERLRRVYRSTEYDIDYGSFAELEAIYPLHLTERIKGYYKSGRSLVA